MKFHLKNFLIAGFSLLFLISRSTFVLALELEISGNGSSSDSQVSVQEVTQSTVEQANQASVGNSVTSDSNTGDNSASGNTGSDVSVATGDTSSQASTTTSVNFSSVDIGCCPTGTSLTITGNGSDSQNNIDLAQTATTDIFVSQNANITNSIYGTSNTGENSANYNTGGSISIDTGNINVNGAIINGPVNVANISARAGYGTVSAKIAGNGSGSTNDISAAFFDDVSVYTNFSSIISNYVVWDLNTGKNEANGNTGGNVSIKTGDIDFSFLIKNLANLGQVKIDCCPIPFDPGNGGGPGPGNGGGPSDSGTSSNNGSQSQGTLLSSAAATEAGGPGIAGLSDTSSESAQALFYWISLAMIALGGRLVIGEVLPLKSRKRHK